MWSVGCIMAELLTGQVLFPGTDHIDQLTRILQIVGSPDSEFMQKITSDTVSVCVLSLFMLCQLNRQELTSIPYLNIPKKIFRLSSRVLILQLLISFKCC